MVVTPRALLDLSDVQHRFALGLGAGLSHHVVNKISLEYRRFLLLRLVNPHREIPAPPLIDTYWRLPAADRSAFESDRAALTAGTAMSPDRLVPPRQPVVLAP
ncbi:MAG: hypothetical protein ACRDSZ_16315 [Pseudonocardiaceae bacterium]